MAERAKFFSAPCRVDGHCVYDASGNLIAAVALRGDKEEEAMATRLIAAAPAYAEAAEEFIAYEDALEAGENAKAMLLYESFSKKLLAAHASATSNQ